MRVRAVNEINATLRIGSLIALAQGVNPFIDDFLKEEKLKKNPLLKCVGLCNQDIGIIEAILNNPLEFSSAFLWFFFLLLFSFKIYLDNSYDADVLEKRPQNRALKNNRIIKFYFDLFLMGSLMLLSSALFNKLKISMIVFSILSLYLILNTFYLIYCKKRHNIILKKRGLFNMMYFMISIYFCLCVSFDNLGMKYDPILTLINCFFLWFVLIFDVYFSILRIRKFR
jgi:hypothetical protein